MRKELNVCKTLQTWLKSYGVKSWLNEGNNKFKTKLSQKKPDMIIYSVKLNQYIAVEVKSGDDKNAIRAGTKILDYWKDYVDGKIEYYIKDKKIIINSFCFATIGAMNGKIFLEEDKLKRTELKYRLEPMWEYTKSKEYLRQLWANWNRIRGKDQPGVGIILSNILNESYLDNDNHHLAHPLLFDMQWRWMPYKNKNQWRQNNFLL